MAFYVSLIEQPDTLKFSLVHITTLAENICIKRDGEVGVKEC
jgi:hypothetical protein